jgi:hypothetical protein
MGLHRYMNTLRCNARMTPIVRPVVTLVTLVSLIVPFSPCFAATGDAATGDVTLLRVFLKDGSALVCYGEYARVGDEVVLSMPLGRDLSHPRLQLVTLQATSVDWPRTESYAASARYQRYISTRAEEDFTRMSADTAAMLDEIQTSTDPARAIEIADTARRRLASWPADHYGYRAADVAEIISLIDEATSRIAGAGAQGRPFQVSLVASPSLQPVEAMLDVPAPRDQVRSLVALANAAPRSAERVELWKAAISLIDDPSSGIGRDEAADLRASLDDRIRDETATDELYARMTARLLATAQRAASRALVPEVQRVLDSVSDEDARLGGRRPETARALRAELAATLDAARELRLRRDQWNLRRGVYRAYVESISALVAQLVKAQGSLEAIRSLAGPAPLRLQSLQRSLIGGVERLRQIVPPEQLRPAHDELLTAWQFAESAAGVRLKAVESGDVPLAWQASSAAAGSLMLLSRAQDDIRQALEPPRLK